MPADDPGRAVAGTEPGRTRPLRVVIVNEAFWPSVGGLQKLAMTLSLGLAAAGAEVLVLTRHLQRGAPSRERLGQVEVVRFAPAGVHKGRGLAALLPMLGMVVNLLWHLIRLRRRYDVILAMGCKMLLVPTVAARLVLGKRLVVRAEAPTDLTEFVAAESVARAGLGPASAPLRWWRALAAALLRRADATIAISPEIAAGFAGLGVDPRTCHAVPNGIALERFAPPPGFDRRAARRDLGLPGDAVILLYTGRLSAAKGLMPLLRVFARQDHLGTDLHLVLVGSGADSFDDVEAEMTAFVAGHGLGRRVTRVPEVPDVTPYLHAADLYVFASRYEGFGIAVLEAAAAGLPVLTTAVGAASDIVRDGETGRVVPPGDEAAFAAALEWLLRRRDRWPGMGETARRHLGTRFDLPVMLREHARVLRSVLGS